MERAVFTLTFISGIAVFASALSEMMETPSNYSCCEPRILKFNPKCECSWSVNALTIAHYNGTPHDNNCTSPCKALKDGWLELDQCVDVKAECDCDQGKLLRGENFQFRGEVCTVAAPGNLNGSGCTLKGGGVLVLLGLLVVCWTSY